MYQRLLVEFGNRREFCRCRAVTAGDVVPVVSLGDLIGRASEARLALSELTSGAAEVG